LRDFLTSRSCQGSPFIAAIIGRLRAKDNRGPAPTRISGAWLLRQRDNFRFGQREYFRFFGLRYSFFRKEDRPYAGGTDHVDQEATCPA
jgi:hypothetical protein